jgi:hypothetical protein
MSRIWQLGSHLFDNHDSVTYGQRALLGWDGAAGSSLSLTQRTASGGAWRSSNPQRTSRVYVASGMFMAPDEATAQAEVDSINAACTLAETTLQVTDSAGTWWARVSVSSDPTWTPNPSSLIKTFSLQLSAADWRKLADPLENETGLPTYTGGLTFPHTFPEVYASTRTGGTISLTNLGNETGPVVARIDGPCTAPVITHTQTGLQVAFSSDAVLAADEFLTVDMENKLVLAGGTSPRSGWVIDRGWSGFVPGLNTWTFGADLASLAQLTITAWPARL